MVEAFVGTDLWTVMRKVYAMPGVAQACLELQERFELDVPLFLAVLQAAGKGSHLIPTRFGTLTRTAADGVQRSSAPCARSGCS